MRGRCTGHRSLREWLKITAIELSHLLEEDHRGRSAAYAETQRALATRLTSSVS